MINNLIKFLIVFVMAFNVFAGGDDRDEAYYENLDAELAAFEAKLIADQAADEMMAEIERMAREQLLMPSKQKLAADKAAAAESTAAYQSKRANDAEGWLLVWTSSIPKKNWLTLKQNLMLNQLLMK